MRLYIKSDFTKEIPFDYIELAKRVWFPEDEQISYSMLGTMMHYKKIFP